MPMNRPYRAEGRKPIDIPGLRPGLTEPPLQGEKTSTAWLKLTPMGLGGNSHPDPAYFLTTMPSPSLQTQQNSPKASSHYFIPSLTRILAILLGTLTFTVPLSCELTS